MTKRLVSIAMLIVFSEALGGWRAHGTTSVRAGVRLDADAIELSLEQLAIHTHEAFGLEMQPPNAAVRRASHAFVDVSGLTVEAAVRARVRANGDFESRSIDGMIVVRPLGSFEPETWLNKRIMRFDVADKTVKDAVYDVHRLFDPGLVVAATAPQILEQYQAQPAKYASIMKPIRVSARNLPVWRILDAIAAAHGNVSWIVKYGDRRRLADRARIELFSLDKWTIVTRARPFDTRAIIASTRADRPNKTIVIEGLRIPASAAEGVMSRSSAEPPNPPSPVITPRESESSDRDTPLIECTNRSA